MFSGERNINKLLIPPVMCWNSDRQPHFWAWTDLKEAVLMM